MKYRIEWHSWHGDKSEIIDAESESDALTVAGQRWSEDEKDRVCEINAYLIEDLAKKGK